MMLSDAVRRGVQAAGFSKATPVQEQVIPKALEGNDLLVFAETGTGKTAAYGLPILERLSRVLGLAASPEPPPPAAEKVSAPPADAPPPAEESAPRRPPPALHALILGPTRETVTRAEGALRTLGQFFPARIRAIFGGVPAAPQREALRRGLHIVAATPGRLAEILRQEPLALDQVEVLVLDELDHMAQMNLMGDVLSIIERIPTDRQTFAFAGKRTADLETLAARFLRDPQLVEVQSSATPISDVRQVLYPVDSLQKSDLMVELLRTIHPAKAVIFFRTRRNVDRLQPLVEQLGRRVAVLHADRTPAQRQAAIEAFTSNEAEILLATEMAVRSLEVEGITHLINFDLPQFPDDYLNRIARCSNLGPIQEVLTLVCPEDRDALRRLEKHLSKSIERVKSPSFNYSDRGRRNVDRILAPIGDHRNGVATDTRRSPRRPLSSPVQPEISAAATKAEAEKNEKSAPRARVSPQMQAPAAAPAGTSAPAPAEPHSAGTPPRIVSNIHFTERLSGRLTRAVPDAPSPGDSPAAAEATPPAAPPAAPPATAPAGPQADTPEFPPEKPVSRQRPTLADEVRHPRTPPARPEPSASASPPSSPPPLPPPLPRRPPTPLPVTAAPALPPPEPPAVDTPAPAKSYPSTSFTSSRKEESTPRSRPSYRHGRKPVQPEWVEEVLEPEILANDIETEGEDETEGEPVVPAADSNGVSPPPRREQGGRASHQTDRRPPRRIRSWDLHRGGLLDPPPLLSTPYDTFLAEERQARKRDSQIQSEEERLVDFPAEAVFDEPQVTEGAGILPIDWDHPVSRHGRVGQMIVAWKKKLAVLQALQGKAGTPVVPAAAASRQSDVAQPAVARAKPEVASTPPPSVLASQKAGLAPPVLPAWPMAADSATTAATAPGVWWTPSPQPSEQSAVPPAPQAAQTAKKATRESSPSHAGKSESSREQRGRRGRGRGSYFRKDSERPAPASASKSTPAPARAMMEENRKPQVPAAAAAAAAEVPPVLSAPPSATPSLMPTAKPPTRVPEVAAEPTRESPARPTSRARKAATTPQIRQSAASSASESALKAKAGAMKQPARPGQTKTEKVPAKPMPRSLSKAAADKTPERPATTTPPSATAAAKKQSGRKPAVKEAKATKKVAASSAAEKKKIGRKPAAKEVKATKKASSAAAASKEKTAVAGASGKAKKQ